MAATRLFSMHQNKGKSIAQCLTDRSDYAKNPDREFPAKSQGVYHLALLATYIKNYPDFGIIVNLNPIKGLTK